LAAVRNKLEARIRKREVIYLFILLYIGFNVTAI